MSRVAVKVKLTYVKATGFVFGDETVRMAVDNLKDREGNPKPWSSEAFATVQITRANGHALPGLDNNWPDGYIFVEVEGGESRLLLPLTGPHRAKSH